MALINCPECGHQMSDTAKKCPNCGYSNNKFNIDSIKPFILGGAIGIIGLFIIILSFPIMSGFGGSIDPISSEFYMGCAMFLCGLIGLFLGFKKLRNQLHHSMLIFWGLSALCVITLVVFFLSVGFHHWESISTTEYEEYEITSQSERSTISSPTATNENAYLGTWEYIQPENNSNDEKLIITINEDNTVTAEMVGDNRIFYGSWHCWGGYGDEPKRINFSFTDTQVYVPPYGNHGGGYTSALVAWKKWTECLDITNSTLLDGFLYAEDSYAKAKNPEKRVKMKKIK
ncbi:MAG: zinc ribbon domain-containing protein [Bacteroides sp.]|nr:zinc ribbon domain-containing protein [Bacteroides sp.]MCM1379674.1 zinc ribbon domain-containing protein [Bacteroides sp.]MCM1445944.1 zinc ribbon domain-containing protein [Prevotella sp.]